MIGRDEKILNDIIRPKDKLIEELYRDNVALHKELSKQAKTIEEAEKYQSERDKIIADNKELHNQVDNIKSEYKNKEFDLEWKYKSKIKELLIHALGLKNINKVLSGDKCLFDKKIGVYKNPYAYECFMFIFNKYVKGEVIISIKAIKNFIVTLLLIIYLRIN